jgi:hypothetical protein
LLRCVDFLSLSLSHIYSAKVASLHKGKGTSTSKQPPTKASTAASKIKKRKEEQEIDEVSQSHIEDEMHETAADSDAEETTTENEETEPPSEEIPKYH